MSLGACSLIQQLTATVVNAWNPLRRVVHIRDMVEVPLSYTLWLDRRVVSINHKALPYRAGILTAHSGFHWYNHWLWMRRKSVLISFSSWGQASGNHTEEWRDKEAAARQFNKVLHWFSWLVVVLCYHFFSCNSCCRRYHRHRGPEIEFHTWTRLWLIGKHAAPLVVVVVLPSRPHPLHCNSIAPLHSCLLHSLRPSISCCCPC